MEDHHDGSQPSVATPQPRTATGSSTYLDQQQQQQMLSNCPICGLRFFLHHPGDGMTAGDTELHLNECLSQGAAGGDVAGDCYVIARLKVGPTLGWAV